MSSTPQDSETRQCGSASDNLYLTFKGGCRKEVTYRECYRCTGCGGRFHKDCILKHFEEEKEHDWGRQQERNSIKDWVENKARVFTFANIDPIPNGSYINVRDILAKLTPHGDKEDDPDGQI